MWCYSMVNTWTFVLFRTFVLLGPLLFLGPLLSLIYENNMSHVINNKLLLYADDYAILVGITINLSFVEKVLQTDIQIVSEWLIDR